MPSHVDGSFQGGHHTLDLSTLEGPPTGGRRWLAGLAKIDVSVWPFSSLQTEIHTVTLVNLADMFLYSRIHTIGPQWGCPQMASFPISDGFPNNNDIQ